MKNSFDFIEGDVFHENCRFHPENPRIAKKTLRHKSGTLYYVCTSCFKRIEKEHTIGHSRSVENIIKLQNRKKNSSGNQLFTSSSVVVPKQAIRFSGQNWGDFGKERFNVRGKLKVKGVFAHWFKQAWEKGEKQSFTQRGEKLVISKFCGKYFLFSQNGKYLSLLDDNYNVTLSYT